MAQLTRIYFSDFFGVDPKILSKYGAFNVACIVDLPLFIDPFLLFTSKKPEYQKLHEEIIRYLSFLRDRSLAGAIPDGLLKAWFCFKEVHQNCLGFCLSGNRGSGLGMTFARALDENLNNLFKDFGHETITKSSHLEKLVLIRDRVGRDNISDFTTNLIKGYLLEYTQTFAKTHIDPLKLKDVRVDRVRFNYEIGYWEDAMFSLPWLEDDYILLTPEDILTKDDTWINKEDLRQDFPSIREAIPNDALRAQIDSYFRSVLPRSPNVREERAAIEKTLRHFPEIIDHFIRKKEDHGQDAVKRSVEKVREVEDLFVLNIRRFVEQISGTGSFYNSVANTPEETKRKILYLKQVIEHQDGYRIFYVREKPVERESDLHILFKLVWEGSPSSADAEVNNGRGPVDFKISRGSEDKTLVEFKLASNSQLERNLENQVPIYEAANQTKQSFKVVIFFNEGEEVRVKKTLKQLSLNTHPNIILIDARRDNKPSASKA
jgi:hypothetical protein